jgi:phosphoglycolate phosphatase
LTNNTIRADHIQGVKGVVFDCDGVLFDSWDANAMFYNCILDKLGQPPMGPEHLSYVHCHTVTESLARIVPTEMRDRVAEAVAGVDYATEVMPSLKPEPGVYELLDFMQEQGLRMAVNTNRSTTMEMVADHFNLTEYFSAMVTASMVARPKPDPEGVHCILCEWGLDPSQTAFIGDSEVDEATARAAGVRFWSYKNPDLKADLSLPDFPSLHQALKTHLSTNGGEYTHIQGGRQ